MSKTATSTREVPETTVRNRSQYADTLHRIDSDHDEPFPACWEQNRDGEFTDVPTVAYLPHYNLCGNPECFGGEQA
ncbi:hypothetical protein ACFR9U_00830 [Halorientalis brevis]|uniref:Uncharacterized protein n=1 Tax=Halorientalis brevis TaxID=1126241 RepID=A0ABD6C5P3_9EURY|nr:hypothetical protein [Halorientalis brevis]